MARSAGKNGKQDNKMASTYRYNARKTLGLKLGKRRGRRRRGGAVAVVATTAAPAKRGFSGIDELLAAGSKMGWGRVKELVDKIAQAPDVRNE